MFKTVAATVVLFLACFASSFGQSIAPTLGRNNIWTGSNTFNGGLHVPVLQQCSGTQVMAGYNTNFSPICVNQTGGGGAIQSLNGQTASNLNITNTDGNLNISPQGSTSIQINCPGCGGSGGTPGGGNGAIQQNQSGSFVGTVLNGIVFAQSSSNVRAAIADTDFALPFTLTCTGGGISCPKTGENYTFTVSGGAGSGTVSSAQFGQMGGYPATGTTISGAPNIYSLNPAWAVNQMSGLMSRFSGSVVTNVAVASNVVTVQAINGFNAGDVVATVYFSNATWLDNQLITVSATGLSNTQFEFAFTHANQAATADNGYATINVPQQPLTSQGVVIIPPGLIDNPSTQFINHSVIGPAAQVADMRKGYWMQQASAYGVKCDAQQLYVTLTAGSDLVTVGSSFSSFQQPIGMDMVVGQQVGYAGTGTQNTWDAKVIAYPYPNLQLSANAPFSYSGTVTFGTNNASALQTAMNDVGGGIPLWLPQCAMLTSTVRWNGASLLGQQMNDTSLYGFPAQDILQAQDGTPITAWSINASTGVTTFTIPSYAAHNILAATDYPNAQQWNLGGDSINLRNFGTSTFFNNQNANIATHPTPTTFTVNNTFGQSTSSGTEAGLAAPNTSVAANAMRVENFAGAPVQSVDPSYSWNSYDQNGTLTVEPPMYRPIQEFTPGMNDPFAPGWGTGQVNGVATITQNTAVICAPNAGRIPVVGQTIVFPYQTGGMFTATVSSTAGSCSAGFTARTLSSALPNTSGYTATQAAWFTFTTVQNLAVAMPGTITLPYTVTMTIPFPPIPGWESNVAPHGHVAIGNQEWDYMGDSFGGTAGGTAVIVLRNGPTTVNGGAGYAIGTTAFPLNPCQAMYHNPWPVVPTINGGNATPVNATYYAGNCGGNAFIALPMADANAWAPFNEPGFSIAYFNNVACSANGANAAGNTDSNGSMCIYEGGNYTGYGNTFDNLRIVGTWGGFMQGPAAVNQTGVRTVGPTSTGQSITNCTVRAGYGFSLVNMNQSNIGRCDTYSTEVSQYDGAVIGASTGLHLGYTLSETDGGGVTGIGQFTVKDYNNEPENGTHEEFMPSVVSDGNNITWLGTIFEGGYNVFGGSFQQFHGTQMAVPIFNYGQNNYFDKLYAVNVAYNDGNVYNGTSTFYNWGSFGTCQEQSGAPSPLHGCGVGFMQSYNGHDVWSAMFGSMTAPAYNVLGGMISPNELASGTLSFVWDSTELWYGNHVECNVGTGLECVQANFDGTGGGIYIGYQQRVPPTQVVVKMNVKAKTSGTFNFRLLVSAQNPGGGSCTPNYFLAQASFAVTSTGWTTAELPVDFTSYAGCSLGLQEDSGSATNVLEIGAVNIVPYPGTMYIPMGSPTSGAACPVVGNIKFDATHIWICAGGTFGAGTWKSSPIS
jgi:hypothetical protein